MDCRSLTSIILPDSITSLGAHCFDNCESLTDIKLPNSISSLPSGCFYACKSLTSIVLPNTITTIGKICFMNCKSLTSINLSDSITLGEGCFNDCDSLNEPDGDQEKRIDIEKITKLAAQGDATAKQQLAKYEWHVGDNAYVRMFGEWEKLKITRYGKGEDKLNEQEVEQLLWLCTEFDGKDENLVDDALNYSCCDGGEIINDFDEDDLSDEYIFKNLCIGVPCEGKVQLFVEGECLSDSDKLNISEGTVINFNFSEKKYVDFYFDDEGYSDEDSDDEEVFDEDEE